MIAAVLTLTLVVCALTATTFGWLSLKNKFPVSVKSGVKLHYFERGTGTKEDPYIIHTQKHLYNLAWLQNLGKLDGKTYYFQLCDGVQPLSRAAEPDRGIDELDMTGWTLPPIGTSAHPFTSHFDGNNKTIKNLTVTTALNSVTDRPTTAQTADMTAVGVFGTVTGSVANLTLDQIQVNAPGTAAAYVGAIGTVIGSVTDSAKAQNIHVKEITISTTGNANTKSGLAVGYVDAPISGIGVIGGTLNAGSGTSEYSLVGDCSNEVYLSKEKMIQQEIKDPIVTGWTGGLAANSTDWGGSIAMTEMFTMLNGYRRAASADYYNGLNLIMSEKQDEDGNVETTFDTFFDYDFGGTMTTPLTQYNTHTAMGSFSFSSTTTPSTTEQYIYLFGRSTTGGLGNYSRKVSTITTKLEPLENGFLIYHTDDSEVHYMNLNTDGTASSPYLGLSDEPQKENATVWLQDEEGHIYTIGQSIDVPDANGGIKYYLNAAVPGEEKDATVWAYDIEKETYTCTVNGTICYIVYQDGHWFIARDSRNVITDHNGHYLSIDANNNITNVSSASFAPEWDQTADNKLSTNVNGSTVYLRNNDGKLELTSQQDLGAEWDVPFSPLQTGGLTLNYLDGWNLTLPDTGYLISAVINDKTYYLTIENRQIASTRRKELAALWTVGNGTLSTRLGNQTYYLNLTTNACSVSTTPGNSLTFNTGNGQIYFSQSGFLGIATYYYLSIGDNGSWKITNQTLRPSGNRFVQFEPQSNYVVSPGLFFEFSIRPVQIDDSGYTLSDIDRVTKTINEQYPFDSWFPISASGSGTNYTPDRKNTGYVISGPYRNSNYNYQQAGDIRVSHYPRNRISGSFDTESNTFKELYTISGKEGGGMQLETIYENNEITNTSFVKFKSSLNNFLSTLTAPGSDMANVYGLHFMEAKIDAGDVVIADEVSINGKTKYNYPLPRHCIDFHLQTQGYINFFAGEYFGTNGNSANSFFSLHRIFRNEEKGTLTTAEITQVYSVPDGKSFIYSTPNGYIDANNNPIKLPEDNTLLFDTSWISKNGIIGQKSNRIFYFEIPVDAGEYALGSVNSANAIGGYLLYLDISANGQDHEYTVTEESLITREAEVAFPNGVDLINEGDDSPEKASFAAKLTGNDSYSFQLNDSAFSITSTSDSAPSLGYVKNGSSVLYNAQQLLTTFPDDYTQHPEETVITLHDHNLSQSAASAVTVRLDEDDWPFKDSSGKNIWDENMRNTYRTYIAGVRTNILVNDPFEDVNLKLQYLSPQPVTTDTTLVFDQRSLPTQDGGPQPKWHYDINLNNSTTLTVQAQASVHDDPKWELSGRLYVPDSSGGGEYKDISESGDYFNLLPPPASPALVSFALADLNSEHRTSYPAAAAPLVRMRMQTSPLQTSYGRITSSTIVLDQEPPEIPDPVECGDVQFITLMRLENTFPDGTPSLEPEYWEADTYPDVEAIFGTTFRRESPAQRLEVYNFPMELTEDNMGPQFFLRKESSTAVIRYTGSLALMTPSGAILPLEGTTEDDIHYEAVITADEILSLEDIFQLLDTPDFGELTEPEFPVDPLPADPEEADEPAPGWTAVLFGEGTVESIRIRDGFVLLEDVTPAMAICVSPGTQWLELAETSFGIRIDTDNPDGLSITSPVSWFFAEQEWMPLVYADMEAIFGTDFHRDFPAQRLEVYDLPMQLTEESAPLFFLQNQTSNAQIRYTGDLYLVNQNGDTLPIQGTTEDGIHYEAILTPADLHSPEPAIQPTSETPDPASVEGLLNPDPTEPVSESGWAAALVGDAAIESIRVTDGFVLLENASPALVILATPDTQFLTLTPTEDGVRITTDTPDTLSVTASLIWYYPEETEDEPEDSTDPTEETAPTEETEPSEETTPSEETEPSEETAPSEETEPSEVTEPSEITEPSEGTKPSEETVPSEETKPSEETEPSDVIEPSEETAPSEEPEATEVPSLPLNYRTWMEYRFGSSSQVVMAEATPQAVDFTARIFRSTLLLRPEDRLSGSAQPDNPMSSYPVPAIRLGKDPASLRVGKIRIRYTASFAQSLCFDLGGGQLLPLSYLEGLSIESEENNHYVTIPTTPANMARFLDWGESYGVIPAAAGEEVAIHSIRLDFVNAPNGELTLWAAHGGVDLPALSIYHAQGANVSTELTILCEETRFVILTSDPGNVSASSGMDTLVTDTLEDLTEPTEEAAEPTEDTAPTEESTEPPETEPPSEEAAEPPLATEAPATAPSEAPSEPQPTESVTEAAEPVSEAATETSGTISETSDIAEAA